MNQIIDESQYKLSESWWNPCFLELAIEKEFRLQSNSSMLPAVRIGLGIIIFFWCGFILFDQFLSPSSKPSVLLFRFAVVTPLLLILGAVSFSKISAQLCQILVVLIEFITFAALIRVVYLYDDFGILVNQFGFHLSMPSRDAKFIFVVIWIIVVFVGSLSLRIRTSAVGKRELSGSVIRLSKKCAEVIIDQPVEMLSNLKMNLKDVDENLAIKYFYVKVIECETNSEKIHTVRFIKPAVK